jgi:hypothetical protein
MKRACFLNTNKYEDISCEFHPTLKINYLRMKRNTILITLAFVAQFIAAQPVLTYNTHAFLPGMNNPMTLCNYTDPGVVGDNVTWDFSSLEPSDTFTGKVNSVVTDNDFTDATVVLEEFGTSFFFESDENSIRQVGYKSSDSRVLVKYNDPYDKMVYPLIKGDLYNCSFTGNYFLDGSQVGEINGTGTIEADAWGTIKLPKNKTYENTMRVKSVKAYTIAFSDNATQEVEVVSYRWYNNFHRYPLLVLTQYTTTSGQNVNTNYQSAYNNNAVSSVTSPINPVGGETFSLYPNPAQSNLNLYLFAAWNKSVQLKIYDVSGKIVLTLQDRNVLEGENIIDLSREISVLKPGSYVLNISSGSNLITREFILTGN